MTGVALAWGVAAHAGDCTPADRETAPLKRFEFLQIRMAIPVRITLYATDEATANLAAESAYRRFRELDRLLSDYDPDSELSRLCATSGPGQPVEVSQELFTVLSHAERLSRQTSGAFDVTVGPLTDLWRKVRRRKLLPPDEERREALSRVGWGNVDIDREKSTVELRLKGMSLDLGGIAKGYAADQALQVMAETGVTQALVDAGGDVVVGDAPPGRDGWTIGIAPLADPRGQPERFIQLANASAATSGDASQHVEIDGVRYSHIVDPRTGMGVTTPGSVTVVSPEGITADSLASAVSVLGPARGIELIDTLDGVEASIVIRDASGRMCAFESSDWSELLLPTGDP